ncbi:MAG: P1 family peptidase [Bacillota bacterium]
MKEIDFNEFKGIMVGNAENSKAGTGCTVAICPEGATAGVDVRGGAPGTREISLLSPEKMIQKIHAILLTGGSAYGLDAASGVMEYLSEKNIGYGVGNIKVPIVPGAVLFDLVVGSNEIRPDSQMGYQACQSAGESSIEQGNIGAGTGATIGKYGKPERAMKGGLGFKAFQVGELKVGALVVVNCLGDIYDPEEGRIIAGSLDENGLTANSIDDIVKDFNKKEQNFGNTTLGIVFTNGKITKTEANKIASIAHNGYGQTIIPSHTNFDGDTIFVMATGKVESNLELMNLLAVKSVAGAVLNGVKQATSSYGFMSYNDIR